MEQGQARHSKLFILQNTNTLGVFSPFPGPSLSCNFFFLLPFLPCQLLSYILPAPHNINVSFSCIVIGKQFGFWVFEEKKSTKDIHLKSKAIYIPRHFALIEISIRHKRSPSAATRRINRICVMTIGCCCDTSTSLWKYVYPSHSFHVKKNQNVWV